MWGLGLPLPLPLLLLLLLLLELLRKIFKRRSRSVGCSFWVPGTNVKKNFW